MVFKFKNVYFVEYLIPHEKIRNRFNTRITQIS